MWYKGKLSHLIREIVTKERAVKWEIKKEKWNDIGTSGWCCRADAEQLWNLKGKAYKTRMEQNGNQWSDQLVVEQKRKETEMVFCLREWGVGGERGKVMKLVQWCKEFCKGKVWGFIGREENVGDIVEANEFCNRTIPELEDKPPITPTSSTTNAPTISAPPTPFPPSPLRFLEPNQLTRWPLT